MKYTDHTILLAHGSRDIRWTEPFEVIASKAKKQCNAVSLAYMELAEPNLEQAIKQAKAAGANKIVILPLFFAAGKHLREDVPAMLDEISRGEDIAITLLPPIGEQADFQTAIVDTIGKLLIKHSELALEKQGK